MITETPQDQPASFGTEYWSAEVIGTINLEELRQKLEWIYPACVRLYSFKYKLLHPDDPALEEPVPETNILRYLVEETGDLPLAKLVKDPSIIAPDDELNLKKLRQLNKKLLSWLINTRKVKDLLGNPNFIKVQERPDIVREVIVSLYTDLIKIFDISLPYNLLNAEQILNIHEGETGVSYLDLQANFRYGADSQFMTNYLAILEELISNPHRLPISAESQDRKSLIISPVASLGILFGYIYQQILLDIKIKEIANADPEVRKQIFTLASQSYFTSSTYTENQVTTGVIEHGMIDKIIELEKNHEKYEIYIVEDVVFSGLSPGTVAKLLIQELKKRGVPEPDILINVKIVSARDNNVFHFVGSQYEDYYYWQNNSGKHITIEKGD